MFQNDQWVFFSLSKDQKNGIITHFYYNLNAGSNTATIVIANISATGAYNFLPSTNFTWGGVDQTYKYCDCTMQYLRFYLNLALYTSDQMINLALMNPQSKNLLLYSRYLFSPKR